MRKALFDRALDPDAAAANLIFLAKARLGMTERQIIEHEGAAMSRIEIIQIPDNGRDPALVEQQENAKRCPIRGGLDKIEENAGFRRNRGNSTA